MCSFTDIMVRLCYTIRRDLGSIRVEILNNLPKFIVFLLNTDYSLILASLGSRLKIAIWLRNHEKLIMIKDCRIRLLLINSMR